MKIVAGGVFIYDNVEELNYAVLNALGLSVMANDGSVFDTELKLPLKFADNVILANINAAHIRYAGEGQVMLDIITNIKMVSDLFGHLLDKIRVMEGKEIASYYPETIIEESTGLRMVNLTLRFSDNQEISSEYYYNRCLSFVELILKLGEISANIRNFDPPPELEK